MRLVPEDAPLSIGVAAIRVVVPFEFAGRQGSGIFSARPGDGDLGIAFVQLAGASLSSFEPAQQRELISGLHDAAVAAVEATLVPEGMPGVLS